MLWSFCIAYSVCTSMPTRRCSLPAPSVERTRTIDMRDLILTCDRSEACSTLLPTACCRYVQYGSTAPVMMCRGLRRLPWMHVALFLQLGPCAQLTSASWYA